MKNGGLAKWKRIIESRYRLRGKNIWTNSINPKAWDGKSIDVARDDFIVVGTGTSSRYFKYIGSDYKYSFTTWAKDTMYPYGAIVKNGTTMYKNITGSDTTTTKFVAAEWEKLGAFKAPNKDPDNWEAYYALGSKPQNYDHNIWEQVKTLANFKPDKNTDDFTEMYDLVSPKTDTTHWESVDFSSSLGNIFADNAKYILFPRELKFGDAAKTGWGDEIKNRTTVSIKVGDTTIKQNKLTFSKGYFGKKPKMDSSGRVVIKDGKIVSTKTTDYNIFFLSGNAPKYSFIGTDGNVYEGTYETNDAQWDTKESATFVGTSLYLGDIEELKTSEAREKAVLNISLFSSMTEYYNPPYGGDTNTRSIDFPNWCYTIRAPKDCAIKNHKYTSKIVWESEVRDGVTHYPRAHFEHVCEKCLHALEPEAANVIPELSADGKRIAYKCLDPITGQEFTRQVLLSGAVGKTFALHGNNAITGTPKDHPCFNDATGRETIFTAGSKSQAKYGGIYKSASTSVSFTVPAGYIKAGAQSLTLKMDYSENLDDINIILKDRNGNTITTNKSHGSVSGKIDLSQGYIDDSQLNGAYLIVDARVSARSYASSYWDEPTDAYAFIKFNALEVRY